MFELPIQEAVEARVNGLSCSSCPTHARVDLVSYVIRSVSLILLLQPIYASLSDIVVYSPRGLTRSAVITAERFKQAVELKYMERRARCPDPESLVPYNVFVLDASASELAEKLPHLVVRTEDTLASGAHTDGTDAHTSGEPDEMSRLLRANTIDFAQREKEEMRDLTQASEIVSQAVRVGSRSSIECCAK